MLSWARNHKAELEAYQKRRDSLHQTIAENGPQLSYLVGQHFPIENFKNASGQHFHADFLKGKPGLINFWFTTCGPCIAELPQLNSLQEKLGERARFLGITFDSREKVEAFLRKHSFNVTQITDAGKMLDQLGVTLFPTTVLVDREGVVRKVYFPGIKAEELSQIKKWLKTR